MTSQRRQRGERGSASIEMVVWLPLLFGLMFLAMQGALYFYGRSAALSAATAGARAGAVEHGTSSDCQSAAREVLATTDDALTNPQVACSRTATTMTVTVTGTTLSVVPFVLPTTSQSASLPVESLS